MSADTFELTAFYIFNSNEISFREKTSYGRYAEGELLRGFHQELVSRGGLSTRRSLLGVSACHGDIFESDPFGRTSTCTVLGSWLVAGVFQIDSSCLDPVFVSTLCAAGSLGYIPYLVGVSGIPDETLLSTDRALRAKKTAGYLGMFTLKGISRIEEVASSLQLPSGMKITGQSCKGWLVSPDLLQELGLKGEF